MKKIYLLLIATACTAIITYSQNQGYSWTFNNATPPFISTPILGGSPNYTLSTMGGGSITTGVAENPGIGTSCNSNIEVGAFSTNFGFNFLNDDGLGNHPVANTYTIEMVVNFDNAGNWIKLLGFSDLSSPEGNNAIYLSPDGYIDFYTFPYDNFIPASTETPIVSGVWQHLTFVRDQATNKIMYYQNGILRGSFTDNGAYSFAPNAANNFAFHFLKDIGTEESSGKIAKLNIYNRKLSSVEIMKSYNSICDPAFQLSTNTNPQQGYQWSFGATPFMPFLSSSAIGGGTVAYPLSTLGGGSFIQEENTDLISIGAGCAGSFKVAAYTEDAGLNFSNDPLFALDDYTIEMVVNFTETNKWIKVLGFSDVNTPEGDYGIYISPEGYLDFYIGYDNLITDSPVTAGTWYHLMFIRNYATQTISYYQNGILRGTFADVNAYSLFPKLENNYAINFLKDNGQEESEGKLLKLAVFNFSLSPVQVQQRFVNTCVPNEIPLPVTLTDFSASKKGNEVVVNWTTVSEKNSAGFEIQRSNNDQNNFVAIGFVNSSENSNSKKEYAFYDRSPLKGKNYYRLKQLDLTNNFKLSSVKMVDMDKAMQDIQVFPNPASNFITVTNLKAGSSLSVYNNQGQRIITKTTSDTQEQIAVEKLTKGVYVIQVTEADGNKRTVRFTKL